MSVYECGVIGEQPTDTSDSLGFATREPTQHVCTLIFTSDQSMFYIIQQPGGKVYVRVTNQHKNIVRTGDQEFFQENSAPPQSISGNDS